MQYGKIFAIWQEFGNLSKSSGIYPCIRQSGKNESFWQDFESGKILAIWQPSFLKYFVHCSYGPKHKLPLPDHRVLLIPLVNQDTPCVGGMRRKEACGVVDNNMLLT